MQIIHHRINSLEQLNNIPHADGAEIDIRYHDNDLILHHDPFVKGVLFDEWISHYRHGTLILNVKEEGLEERIIQLLKDKGVREYFFLDQSFPFLIKWASKISNKCAVRLSEYECIETVLNLSGIASWVWVDCFTKYPFDKTMIDILKHNNFKICLVSPELQGRSINLEVPVIAKFIKENNIDINAICTKNPEIWQKEFLR